MPEGAVCEITKTAEIGVINVCNGIRCGGVNDRRVSVKMV